MHLRIPGFHKAGPRPLAVLSEAHFEASVSGGVKPASPALHTSTFFIDDHVVAEGVVSLVATVAINGRNRESPRNESFLVMREVY